MARALAAGLRARADRLQRSREGLGRAARGGARAARPPQRGVGGGARPPGRHRGRGAGRRRGGYQGQPGCHDRDPSLHLHRQERNQVRRAARPGAGGRGAHRRATRDSGSRRSPCTSAASSPIRSRSGRGSRGCSSWRPASGRRGATVEVVDIGGGMGIRYGSERRWSPGASPRRSCRCSRRAATRSTSSPAASWSGAPGVLLTEVLYRKHSGGKEFIVVDAGMNDLVRPEPLPGLPRDRGARRPESRLRPRRRRRPRLRDRRLPGARPSAPGRRRRATTWPFSARARTASSWPPTTTLARGRRRSWWTGTAGGSHGHGSGWRSCIAASGSPREARMTSIALRQAGGEGLEPWPSELNRAAAPARWSRRESTRYAGTRCAPRSLRDPTFGSALQRPKGPPRRRRCGGMPTSP